MKSFVTKSKGAFTLIEMLIVVAIIGILVGLGVPALRTAKKDAADAKVNSAVAQIETAKNRLILETNPPADVTEFTSAQLTPFLVHRGATPSNVNNLLEGTGKNFVALGGYTAATGAFTAANAN